MKTLELQTDIEGHSLDAVVRHREQIVTEALGFKLELEITVGELDVRGRHRTHEDEHGQTCDEHRIELRDGLSGGELAEVAAHEAYHLLYSVRNRITADEETEAEVFGHLVKRLYEAAQMPNDQALPQGGAKKGNDEH